MVNQETLTKMLTSLEEGSLRERYQAEVTPLAKGWGHSEVKIWDRQEERLVHEYTRNYSFLQTFEPLRLWREEAEEWGHYALISPHYTGFQLLNLDSGEVVYDHKGGRTNFCPRAFFVPDFHDYLEGEAVDPQDPFSRGMMETFLKRRTHAFVQGCVWGDDSSWKVRTLDLQAMLRGEEVAVEEKFGYLVLNGPLREGITFDYFFDDGYGGLSFTTPLYFRFHDEAGQEVRDSHLESEPREFKGTWGQDPSWR